MTLDVSKLTRDFGDVAAEVRSCRNAAALFDFSFVARARMQGPRALEHFPPKWTPVWRETNATNKGLERFLLIQIEWKAL